MQTVVRAFCTPTTKVPGTGTNCGLYFLRTFAPSLNKLLTAGCMQLDDPSRGLAFRTCGPLDMRMDPTLKTSAADVSGWGKGQKTSCKWWLVYNLLKIDYGQSQAIAEPILPYTTSWDCSSR